MMTSLFPQFTSESGLHVWVRPLRPDDAPHLIDIFEHLGPQSRYLRFHEPLDAPDPAYVREQAEEIAETTWRRGRGWLAFADLPGEAEAAIGGVRWLRVGEHTAEVALTVRDDLQNQGIGRELLRIAVQDARAEGITRLTAVVQATNRAVVRLLNDAPFPVKRSIQAGEMFVEADLSGEIDWQAAPLAGKP